MLTTCLGLHSIAERSGFELATYLRSTIAISNVYNHTISCDCRLICTAQQLSCDQVKRLTELWPRTCHTYMKSNSHVGLAASAQYSINTSYLTGLN